MDGHILQIYISLLPTLQLANPLYNGPHLLRPSLSLPIGNAGLHPIQRNNLVFPSGIEAFNNRVQKISSLAAGYCSARLDLHLSAAVTTTPDLPVKEGILGTAYFDARLFTAPTIEEALNYVLWRCRSDAVINSVGAFARTLYTTKELL
jgi:hypothetical protein